MLTTKAEALIDGDSVEDGDLVAEHLNHEFVEIATNTSEPASIGSGVDDAGILPIGTGETPSIRDGIDSGGSSSGTDASGSDPDGTTVGGTDADGANVDGTKSISSNLVSIFRQVKSGKVKVLYILGIDDSNKIEILFLSPNRNNMRFNFRGNVHLLPLIDTTNIEVHRITVGGMKGQPFKMPKVDLIFNAICDPDSNQKSLQAALNIIDALKVPVFNHPQYILKTGRENIYELFKGLDGAIVPKTIRIRPRYLSDVVKTIDSGELQFPFLFREGGYHGGKNLELVANMDQFNELEKFPFDGRDYYLSRFVDFQSRDGLYRKCRVIVIGGKPYPRHLIISDLWNVHAESRKRLMDTILEYREEEENFLREFDQRDLSIFYKLYEHLKLDFFGVDFSYDADGRMVIFEVNSCFKAVVHTENRPSNQGVNALEKGFVYHKPYIESIKKAVETLISEKAGYVRHL